MQTPRHLIRALLSAVALVVGLMAFPATASATTTADPLPTGCVDVSDDATVRTNCNVTVNGQLVTIQIQCNGHNKPSVQGTTLIFNDQTGNCNIDITTALGTTVSFGCMGNGPNNFEIDTATLSFRDYSAGQCDTTIKAGEKFVSGDTKGQTETEIRLTTTTVEVTTHGPASLTTSEGVNHTCGGSSTVRADGTDPLNPQMSVTNCLN
ncbi:hypothetical protein QWM81_20120 [Streptomyces ficellus]|uniref:DUF3060 domain-containing protein n=1 Tax=Streptomyces ficellus TaxID=1977088 RepID=A0ABT7Z9Z4_9ACTN|nr:hypothetical protein [Streptomyces ficellus]MDN3296329.1 hypothetical protein [Streptomyces ficellus]